MLGDDFPRALLRHATLRLVHLTLPNHPEARFEGEGSSTEADTPMVRLSHGTADVLTTVLERYLRLLGDRIQDMAMNSGRHACTLMDLDMVLESLDVIPEDLMALALSGSADGSGSLGAAGGAALIEVSPASIYPMSSHEEHLYTYRDLEAEDIDRAYRYTLGSSDLEKPEGRKGSHMVASAFSSHIPDFLPPFPPMKRARLSSPAPDAMEIEEKPVPPTPRLISGEPGRSPSPPSVEMPTPSPEDQKTTDAVESLEKGKGQIVGWTSRTTKRNPSRAMPTTLAQWLGRLPKATPTAAAAAGLVTAPMRMLPTPKFVAEVVVELAPERVPEPLDTLFLPTGQADNVFTERLGSEGQGGEMTVPMGVLRRRIRERGQDAARAALPIAISDAQRARQEGRAGEEGSPLPSHSPPPPVSTAPSGEPQVPRVRLKLSSGGTGSG